MAAVAAIIFAEKVLPYGLCLSRVFALAFIAFGSGSQQPLRAFPA